MKRHWLFWLGLLMTGAGLVALWLGDGRLQAQGRAAESRIIAERAVDFPTDI